MSENIVTIEVNGVKLDVDLHYARRIETLRVGSRVKVLVKESYSKSCKSVDDDELDMSKVDILAKFDKEIAKREMEIEEFKQKRDYFLSHFKAYFQEKEGA